MVRYGPVRQTDDLVGDTAEKCSHDAAPSVGADDDEVGAHLFGDGVDLPPRRSLAKHRFDDHAAIGVRIDHALARNPLSDRRPASDALATNVASGTRPRPIVGIS